MFFLPNCYRIRMHLQRASLLLRRISAIRVAFLQGFANGYLNFPFNTILQRVYKKNEI